MSILLSAWVLCLLRHVHLWPTMILRVWLTHLHGSRKHMSSHMSAHKGPIIPFGAMVEQHPISARNQSRLHQFGKKVLPGIFPGYALIAGSNLERRYSDYGSGRIGKVGRIRNLSSKNQCKRSTNASKEIEFHFPNCRWYSKFVRKRLRIPRTHSKAGITCNESRSQRRTSRKLGEVYQQKHKMTLKPVPTCGQSKVTSFIVITLNLEYISTCRKKNHSQFHWSILTWMCCKKKVSTIIGTSIWIEPYQIHGQDSRSARYWKRNLLQDFCGPGERLTKIKQQPDLRMCGLKYGPKLEKLKKETSKSGQSRSPNSIMFEDWLLFHWSRRWRRKKPSNSNGCGNALQGRNKGTMRSEELWIQQDS